MDKPFLAIVEEMKDTARVLLPYSYPQTSHEEEVNISTLKKKEVEVDGYDVIVYFNNANYFDKVLESLQIFSKNFTFLPFYLVSKIARIFLGNEKLSFVEVMNFNNLDEKTRKIYVWTLYYDLEGNKIDGPFETKQDSFEGFNFSRIKDKNVKFF